MLASFPVPRLLLRRLQERHPVVSVVPEKAGVLEELVPADGLRVATNLPGSNGEIVLSQGKGVPLVYRRRREQAVRPLHDLPGEAVEAEPTGPAPDNHSRHDAVLVEDHRPTSGEPSHQGHAHLPSSILVHECIRLAGYAEDDGG